MLDALDEVMAGIVADHPNIRVVRFSTKSKMGWLRTYFGLDGLAGPPLAVWPLMRPPIEREEERSARTCEGCGRPGRLRDVEGWLSTLCDADAAERR